jgi:hypothetical protein
MKGYTFDPSRPGVSQAEADEHVADMLRDYLGGIPLEEARRWSSQVGNREATVGGLRFDAAWLTRRARRGKKEA